jgi:hypothetical protein
MSAIRSKVRLYDLARDLKVDTKRLIAEVREYGVDISVPSNSISKELANRIRDQHYPKTIAVNERSAKLVRTTFIGPLPAPKPVARTAIRSASVQIHEKPSVHTSTSRPVEGIQMRGMNVNVLYVPGRKLDADRVKELLESFGATSTLIEVPDDLLSSAHGGRIYYFLSGRNSLDAARRLSEIVSEIQVLVPQFYDFSSSLGITHSMWLTSSPSHFLTASAKPLAAPKGSTSCHICGLVCHRKELNNHLLNNHREEAYRKAVRKLHLQRVTLECYCEIQRKPFAEIGFLIRACLRGWQDTLNKEDQRLSTTDPETLREYARIMESKTSGRSKRAKVVAEVLQQIKTYEGRIPARKLKWTLLPPGEAPFQTIIENFDRLYKENRCGVYDRSRLDAIKSLNPDRTYIGEEEFKGYVAFYFSRAVTAVFECAITGNAIYVFGSDWKSLSRLTKSELLNERRRDVERIVHRGAWFSKLKSLLSTRELQARSSAKTKSKAGS